MHRNVGEQAMIDTTQMDLPALARAYYAGLIDFEHYRSARTDLLDRLTGDATIMVQRPAGPAEIDPKQLLPDEDATSQKSYLPILFGALLVLLVLLILALWYVIK
jgi:hypothetical protein